jgi:hypothetical protein
VDRHQRALVLEAPAVLVSPCGCAPLLLSLSPSSPRLHIISRSTVRHRAVVVAGRAVVVAPAAAVFRAPPPSLSSSHPGPSHRLQSSPRLRVRCRRSLPLSVFLAALVILVAPAPRWSSSLIAPPSRLSRRSRLLRPRSSWLLWSKLVVLGSSCSTRSFFHTPYSAPSPRSHLTPTASSKQELPT